MGQREKLIEALKNALDEYGVIKMSTQVRNIIVEELEKDSKCSNWISVKDRMPLLCVPVLLTGHNKFGNYFPTQIGYYNGCEWTVFGQPMELEKMGVIVTHWMPRPEPPEEVQLKNDGKGDSKVFKG